MIFLADKEIPFVENAFSSLGQVLLLPTSDIDKKAISKADGLLIRSNKKLCPEILHGSRVRFIGTTTIGKDHIQLPKSNKQKIGFASAPGCNSVAVAEFVINALITIAYEKKFSLQKRVLGIVGAGNTGSALRRRAEALGITCLLNDPPLQEKTGKKDYLSIIDLVQQSDIISLHVPLTKTGSYPTFHLIDKSILKQIRPNTILVNTSRGAVVNEKSVLKLRDKFQALIIDVWENEPHINMEFLKAADIATPHVAGYSMEGKIRATEIVYQAACDFFQMESKWSSRYVTKQLGCPEIQIKPQKDLLNKIIMQVFDIRNDDTELRKIVTSRQPAKYFSDLRNNYHFRREFKAYRLKNTKNLTSLEKNSLKALGFEFKRENLTPR